METVIGTNFGEDRALGQEFRGRGGDEHLVGVERVNDGAGVEGIELNAEIGMGEFRAAQDAMNALCEGAT
jgi:hypothetical protein